MPGKKSGAEYEAQLLVTYSRVTREQLKDLKAHFKNRPVATLPAIPEGDPVKQKNALKQRKVLRGAPRPGGKTASRRAGKSQKKK